MAAVSLKERDFASKHDLQVALKEQEIRLIKWIVGTEIGGILAIAGLIKYMH